MERRLNPRVTLFAICLFLFGTGQSAPFSRAVDHPQPLTGLFATPLTVAAIDNSASAEWVDGTERPVVNPAALGAMLWTQSTPPGDGLFPFGAGSQPGVRHLRVGFASSLAIGSILVRGGDRLSVLRVGAKYPGNLADDADWIPAQRIAGNQASDAAVGKDGYATWVLPPGTTTRALRFTHTAMPADSSYAGALGGVYLLTARVANLAPQALVTASANTKAAGLLVDEQYNGWLAWDNGPAFLHPVTAATPETITLTWTRPVAISGLAALWAGFNGAKVEYLSGPETFNPQDAAESNWHTLTPNGKVGWSLTNQYPRALGIDWFDFGQTVTTRAIRVRMTQVTDESRHPHLAGKTKNGNRVWLGELMALSPLGSGDLKNAILPALADVGPKPPIPIHFTMKAAGFVTLVIDDAQGNRVRNLVSDTWFEAGPNTVWWDGTDDLGRNPDAAAHGVYLIPTHFVAPGSYQVHGLTHQAIDLHYEFSVYNAGNPPWETVDGKGGWLTNHTPPSSALFVPGDKAPGGKPLVYLGSYVSEGGAGLAWVDLDGKRQGGRGWIGGNWTAAPFLARDAGSLASGPAYAYVGAAWSDDTNKDPNHPGGVIRITALTVQGDKPVLSYRFNPGTNLDHDDNGRPLWTTQMSGLAVRDNLLVVSLARQGQLLFADAVRGVVIGVAKIDDPRGVVFDAQGRLLVLSGKQLLRLSISREAGQFHPEQPGQPTVVIAKGLEDPAGITLDSLGNLYISDRGNSHQVKIFSASGQFLRAIGHAGAPAAGPYDPLHMNNPRGLAIDSNNHLWVAEEDFQPKRVSLWTLDGILLKSFYGPAEYGGGGSLDPQDKTKLYYHGMQFKLDWQAGTNAITSVLYREDNSGLFIPTYGAPSTAFYSNGHRYFTNTFLGYSTNGVSIAFLYLDKGGVLQPVSAFGKANDWSILKTDTFKAALPAGADLNNRSPDHWVLFVWSDTNLNGKVDPDEVTFHKAFTGSIQYLPDTADKLAVYDAYVDGKANRYAPTRVTPEGVPIYDLDNPAVVAEGAQIPRSDGGGQMLVSPEATVLTTAPVPFAPESVGGIVGGIDKQTHRWSYPSLWPGLHASHSAPVPDRPGELIGTTRLLGGFIHPAGSDTGALWGINGNLGDLYLFTADGLYVTQLFQDSRSGHQWAMPTASRNMVLNDVSLHDEDFFPSLTQTSDGNIYVLDGSRTSIVRVDGLGTLRSVASQPLEVTRADLDKAQIYMNQREASRQLKAGAETLEVPVHAGNTLDVQTLVASLNNADWATIDSRITKVGWGDKPDVVQGTVAVAGGRLYAGFRANDDHLLDNSGTMSNAPFKTGGALDLMIGTNPNANPQRQSPVEGDLRLLVYLVQGKPHATLYRAVVPGTANPVPFSSPVRTITLDQVADVSSQIEFSATSGSYAFSIPLATLGFKASPGQRIKADLGILRGNGVQTTQRVYWSNKATGITSDVPSEAALTPNLWGEWVFKAAN